MFGPRSALSWALVGLVGIQVGCHALLGEELGAGETEDAPEPGDGYCDVSEAWPASSAALEEEVLVLVNEARSGTVQCGSNVLGPAPALRMDSALRCAARVHARDMQARQFFDHENPDGEDPFDRMERAGYSFSAAAENIAFNQPSAEAVVDGWIRSEGHCRNLMSSAFTESGVGHHEGGSGDLWTQTFGAPR